MTEDQDTGREVAEKDKEQEEKASQGSIFEGIYERLPDISVRSLDRFIMFCVIALVAVILIGVLKANHIL